MSQATTLNLETEIAGIKMKNPIMPASGCFGFGRDYAKFYDLSKLGGIAIKATSLESREGNWTPRVAETYAGMINSIGLQNPGLDKVIASELEFLKQYDTEIFANIVGNTVEDYCQVAKSLSAVDNVSAIEMNVSCPNVKNGIHFGSNETELEALTKEVKAVSSKPVFVKLSPNVTNIVAMAKAAERGGADGLAMINTLLGMRIDIKSRKPVIARKMGGLSGPAIKPVAIRMIYEVAQETKLPIIGMGGIMNAEDIIEFALAGASAFALGTVNFIEPTICIDILDELQKIMDEMQINSLTEITGQAWK